MDNHHDNSSRFFKEQKIIIKNMTEPTNTVMAEAFLKAKTPKIEKKSPL
jgi:hypothetical protein